MTDSLRLARVAAVCLFVAATAVWAYRCFGSVHCRPQGRSLGKSTLALERAKPRPFCSVLQRPACWVWRSLCSPRRFGCHQSLSLLGGCDCLLRRPARRWVLLGVQALRHVVPRFSRAAVLSSRLIGPVQGSNAANPSLGPTRTGMALGPPSRSGHHPSAGQAPPALASAQTLGA